MRNRAYFHGMGERFGFLPDSIQTTGPGSIWFHAVSVGEVLSAVELIRRLREEHPRAEMFVSTTTLAGMETARQRLSGLTNGIFLAPVDYRSIVRRVLRRLRPSLVVILETEIWPNLYREAKRAGAGLAIVNGRISDRALPKYERWSGLFRHVLQWPDAILAQSEEDARRFAMAGAPRERVRVAGNLKYDFQPPGAVAPELRELLTGHVWIAASTSAAIEPGDPDEDDCVIAAFRQLAPRHPGLLLVLAPRRPERFGAVAMKLEQSGVRFIRRSEMNSIERPCVLLLDTIGELAGLFELATVVFMGGTLPHRGGHNILEPAYFGKPAIAGPHMENFAEIAAEFTAAQAIVRIERADQLAPAFEALLEDREVGSRARALAESRRGVVDRVATEIASYAGVPDPPRTLAARAVLKPLACAWAAGHRLNVARQQPRALDTPVISVGGLSMGGAGKTPMVLHLASRLPNTAILTRGYKRDTGGIVIVPRGEQAPIEQTGDEAQMFIRRGVAHVGIGADRYETGRLVERKHAPSIFLLDDGFQHVRLKRDHDILLIDALDPWGGGLFPLGRRREPLEGIARASIVVITRTEGDTSALERSIRRYNSRAPIYRSRVAPAPWTHAARRVGGFCGIGSPRAFVRTLLELNLDVVYRRDFPDHHRYSAQELRETASQAAAAGAEALVTTEKDMMNLNVAETLPLPIICVNIGIEIDNEADLLARLRPAELR